jgi:hypothetical protein
MANPKPASSAKAGRHPRNDRSGSAALVLRSAATSGKPASLAVAVQPEVLRTLAPKRAVVRDVAKAMGAAIRQAQESGGAGGFTFKVNAKGEHEIAPLANEAGSEPGLSPEERTQRAFAAARERGRIRAAEILDQDDMLSADDFARRLGVSRVTVTARRQKHELLGLDGAKRGYRFPKWQVDDEGKAFEALPRLFEVLGPSPWGVYRFLVQRHNVLKGATAKDALRRGQTQAVIDAAESLARGDFS